MPRQARRKSKTGIYHIMLRGVNQQNIFEDQEDYEKLLETIKTYKAISGYQVFAYCLMGNHFHLLLKIEKEELDLIIRRIAGSFVYWYNWKYYRRGHLFQERFKSEPIEDEGYFFTVLRYIHQNPVKTGHEIDYKYSSYNDYISFNKTLVDVDFVFSMMSLEEFANFHKEKSSAECSDLDEKDFRLSDIDAKKIIEKVSSCKDVAEFQRLEKEQRNKHIKELRENGLSIRQISRLTGISKRIVEKI